MKFDLNIRQSDSKKFKGIGPIKLNAVPAKGEFIITDIENLGHGLQVEYVVHSTLPDAVIEIYCLDHGLFVSPETLLVSFLDKSN